MSSNEIAVRVLSPDQWSDLKAIRLSSLRNNPESLEGDYATESEYSHEQWRELFKKCDWLIASINGEDVGLLNIEVLDGDFGATCWIGACWVDESARGKGVLPALFRYIDSQSLKRGWQKQGLGVLVANSRAIRAYEKLGFTKMGDEKQASLNPPTFYQRMIRESDQYTLCRLQ